MKHVQSLKTIAVMTALLLLIASLSIPALAAEDPVTYTITIESGSDVFTPETPTVTVQDGETYTFSIPEDVPNTLYDEELGEYEVEFSCWRFTGEYEAIDAEVNADGECTERTVTLKPKSDLKAVACFYEDNALFYMVDVDTNSDAYRPLIDQGECPKGETWTFSVPENMADFDCWEFDGEFEVVQGSVNENRVSFDRTVVLKPLNGVKAFARFNEPIEEEKNGAATGDQATPDQKGNDSKTSPKTGDPLPALVCIMLLAAAAGAIAIRKIKE